MLRWRSASARALRLWKARRFAHMATTLTIRMPVRRMVTTVLTGSLVVCLLAPAHGMAGATVTAGDAALRVRDVALRVRDAALQRPGVELPAPVVASLDVAGQWREVPAAARWRVAAIASPVLAVVVASMAAAVSMVAVDSTAVEAMAAAIARFIE